ncbi:MAG: hypothetical protein IJM25_05080 [Eubacterium sp.]|nr:hypothetical protein [Eubacterium sp.]
MSVSVFFSNQIIQIALGTRAKRGNLKAVYTTMAPEGSIINGIIMDAESLGEHVRSFWEANNFPKKDVYLVVNSNKIAGKSLSVPILNDKKTLGFIMREFADMQREDADNTLAYTQMGMDRKAKVRKLYAEMAPKDQLKEFIQLFQGIGIELKGIISGEESIIGYAGQTILKQAKTFVLQIINGNLVSNVLFADGEFKYYNSIRCFNEPGTEAYMDDLARSLNQMEQFMGSQKITSPIEKVLVAGSNGGNLPMYRQAVVDRGINAPVEIINTGVGSTPELEQQAQMALFAVSGLFDQGKSSNFLSYFNAKDEEKPAMDPKTRSRIISVIVTFIVMAVAMGIALTMRLIRNSQYNEVHDYNSKPSTKLQVMAYDEAVTKRDSMLAKYNAILFVSESVKSYPLCNKDIVQILEDTAKGYAEIEMNNFNAETGKVGFTAKADNVNDIYLYIDRLLNEKIFMTVTHTGYTYDNKTGLYNIHVECTLAEEVGRTSE